MRNFSIMACLAILSACNLTPMEESFSGSTVEMQFSLFGWSSANGGTLQTKSENSNMLYPIQVYYVVDGETSMTYATTLTNHTQFSMTLPNGDYDIYAICGLDKSLIPTDMTTPMSIPDASIGGKIEFAVGKASVTVENGKSSPSELNILAERQMAWLETTVSGVPEAIESLNLYIKGLTSQYTIGDGWLESPDEGNKFYQLPTQQSQTESDKYLSSCILSPSALGNRPTIVAHAKTRGGTNLFMQYSPNTPFTAGTHMTLDIQFADFAILEENSLAQSDWSDRNESGSMIVGSDLRPGDQYLSLPALVFNVSLSNIYVLPFKAINATLSEVNSWPDLKQLNYTETPEIKADRWALPYSSSAPESIMRVINSIGWDAFCQMFENSGCERLDINANDILAYKDANGTFYRYDFANRRTTAVDSDCQDTFRIFPPGVIPILQK